MTLSSTDVKNTYAGTGAQTAFPVTFIFWGLDDLQVVLTTSGVDAAWIRGTHYTVTGGAGSTGTVTSTAGNTPANGTTLTIKSALPNTQPTGVPLGGDLPSAAIEQQFDQTVRQGQQRDETIGRQLTYPISDAVGISSELPNSATRASKFLAFDAGSEPIASAGAIGTVPVSTFMETLLDDTSAAAGRTTLNAQDDVITTRGDIIVGNSTPVASRLAIAAANLLVGSDGVDVVYSGGTVAKTNADSPYTVVTGDRRKTIRADATSGAITITLPASATAGDGFEITVVKTDSSVNIVTVDGNGAETIDAPGGNRLSVAMPSQFDRLKLVCDGTKWTAIEHRLTFTSTEQTLSTAGLLTIAHGLGVRPDNSTAWVVCQTAENGFSIGDRVRVSITGGVDATTGFGFVVVPDSTNLNVRFGTATTGPLVLRFDTGAQIGLTFANWRLVFKAWL